MARLANISGKEAAKAFEKAGWVAIGQVGSHLVLVQEGVRANLSIPQHKELSIGPYEHSSETPDFRSTNSSLCCIESSRASVPKPPNP